MQCYDIQITAKDENEARKIGRALVEEKLAACVNIHPVQSIYRWQGKIEQEGEAAMLVKTKATLVDEVIERVKELHSYQVPCVIALPIEKGNPDYLKWIEESTK
ncbi:MAG: divalent-cation tolerance protein CutA [Chloroflexi bacterium]|nr:divalent-cation tolerance protein CutA [Chloroflexota bacterium]